MEHLWWSACLGCGLWGLIIGTVGTLLVVAVVRAWKQDDVRR